MILTVKFMVTSYSLMMIIIMIQAGMACQTKIFDGLSDDHR